MESIFPIKYPQHQAESVDELITTFRELVFKRRLRIKDYFRDYDKLRSGMVGAPQFLSVLNTATGVNLKPSEVELLMKEYGREVQGNLTKICYEPFCDALDAVFGSSKTITQDPLSVPQDAEHYLNTAKTSRTLSHHAQQIILGIAANVKRTMTQLKPFFYDYDAQNVGKVTVPQFLATLKTFDFNLSDRDLQCLVETYRQPRGIEMLYPDFCADVDAMVEVLKGGSTDVAANFEPTLQPLPRKPVVTNVLDETYENIMSKLRMLVLQQRQRPYDFFRVRDYLRTDLIAEGQFTSIVHSMNFKLSFKEVNILTEHYRSGRDGKIAYKEFCQDLEPSYQHGLEKDPTKPIVEAGSVMTSANHKQKQTLSPQDEAKVQKILIKVEVMVRRNRTLLKPFFADYDVHHTGLITRAQFRNTMSLLNLGVEHDEVELLMKKYHDSRSTLDINYNLFLLDVDNDTYGVQSESKPIPQKTEVAKVAQARTPVDAEAVMDKLKIHVLTKRSRIHEFFVDFDRLRSGSMPKNNFHRACSIANFPVTPQEVEAICTRFEDSNDSEKVKWQDFSDELLTIFTKNNFTRNPLEAATDPEVVYHRVAERTITKTLPPSLAKVVHSFAVYAKQRRILMKPAFADFDKLSHGYVSRQQFRQALSLLGLEAPIHVIDELGQFYKDPTSGDIDYTRLFDDMELQGSDVEPQSGNKAELSAPQARSATPQLSTDVQATIAKIQRYVLERRVRLKDRLRDHDSLRKGYVPKSVFHSLCTTFQLPVSLKEIGDLMQAFETDHDPNLCYYEEFCDLLEAVFSLRGLESNPSADETTALLLPNDANRKSVRQLGDVEEAHLDKVAKRLALTCTQKRIMVVPYFKDYDRSNCGLVSRSQFFKVLSFLQLDLTEAEMSLLTSKFELSSDSHWRRGDMDYVQFCELLGQE